MKVLAGSEKWTLEQCFERYYDKSELRKSTIEAIRVALKRWREQTSNPPVSEIDNELLHEFRGRLIDEGLAPDTINSTWSKLRAILHRIGPRVKGHPQGLARQAGR